MGAALTYARRYALFALVGIAGEDDLDAPDLDAVPNPAEELPRSTAQAAVAQRTAPHGKPAGPSARSILGEQLSASLRESLLQQIAAINSADEAAAWAQRSLPAKNSLTAADAKMVEEQFAARLSEISPPDGTNDGSDRHGTPDDPSPHEPRHAVPDQSVVASNTSTRRKATKKHTRFDVIRLGKTVRLRDKDHRRFVLRQACLVCGRVPSDPHHLTFIQPRALGRRVSDEFIVPVCRVHHRELHRSGDEAAWWRRLNIDPLPIALRLWQQTRSDEELTSIAQRITQAAAQTADMPAPDRAGAGLDAAAEAGGSISENPDRLTRG